MLFIASALRPNPLHIPLLFLVVALIAFGFQVETYGVDLVSRYGHPVQSVGPFNDFMLHWSVARLVWGGHPESAYDALAITHSLNDRFEIFFAPDMKHGRAWSCFYPPTTLQAMSPLALFDFPYAALVFFTLSLLGLCLVTYSLAGMAGLVLLAGAPAVWICIWEGQNGILTSAILGAFLLMLPRMKSASGLALSLLVIKPHLALSSPLALLAGREYRVFAFATLGVLFWVCLSLVTFGPDLWLTYFREGLPAAKAMLMLNYTTINARLVSLYGTLTLLGLDAPLAMAVHLAFAAGVVVATAWAWTRLSDADLRRAMLALSAVMISPMVYDYDLPLTFLTVLFLLRFLSRHKGYALEWILSLSLYFAPLFVYPAKALALGWNPVFFSILFLWSCCLWRAVACPKGQAASSGLASSANIV